MICKCYHADKNFLGKIGVCWGTKECEPCSCNGDEGKCDFYDYVRERAKKPITNADRIRALSDDELAKYFTEKFLCSAPQKIREDKDVVQEVYDTMLSYLKHGVEDVDK